MMSWWQEIFDKNKRQAKRKPEPRIPEKAEVKIEHAETDSVITGDDITYRVPSDMRSLKVELYERNGRFKKAYTLTNWISINPGDKVRIISK
jgi:hypothetical protein